MRDFMIFIKDNLVVITVVAVVIIGIVVYIARAYKGNFFGLVETKQKKTPLINSSALEHDNELGNFIPALTFEGRKPGYVFKTSDKGTGYYKDNIM